VPAHPLQEINKWVQFRKEVGGRKRGKTTGSKIFPGNSISPDRRARLPSELSCRSRKSWRTFLRRTSCFFSLFLSSIVGNEEGNFAEGTFRSIRSKWPARSFPLSRMNFRRVDLRSRKRSWKFKVSEIKVPGTTVVSRETLKQLPFLKS